MYIANQTNQDVTYTSTGPDGDAAACRTQPYTPVEAKREVPAHSGVRPGRRVCFFNLAGDVYHDSVVIPQWCTHFRVILREDFTADVECSNRLLEQRLAEFNVDLVAFRGVSAVPDPA